MTARAVRDDFLQIALNLADLADAATARANLGLTAGGAGDIWLEKAGDTATGPMVFNDTVAVASSIVFGAGQDSAMYFDGDDLVIDPDLLSVGAGLRIPGPVSIGPNPPLDTSAMRVSIPQSDPSTGTYGINMNHIISHTGTNAGQQFATLYGLQVNSGTWTGETAAAYFAPSFTGTSVMSNITRGGWTNPSILGGTVTDLRGFDVTFTMATGSLGTYYGYHCTTPTYFAGTRPTLAAGAWFQPMTLASASNYGIVLDGNGAGSDLLFGAGQDASMYYDGANLIIDPKVTGAGYADIQGDVQATEFRAYASTTGNYFALRAPASVTASTTMTLPDGDGTDGQILQTDGAGVFSWVDKNNADRISPAYVELAKSSAAVQNVGGADGTEVKLSWDVQDHIDDDFTHDTATNNTRIYCNFTGRVQVRGVMGAEQAGANRTTLGARFAVNGGTTNKRGTTRNYTRGSSYGNVSLQWMFEIDVTAGDYIELISWVEDTDAVYTLNQFTDECYVLVRKVVAGGLDNAIVEVSTAAYTAGNESIIWCDASAQAVNIALAPASTMQNKIFHFKKTDATANIVTIDPDGSETIDGELTQTLELEHEAMSIACDGTKWMIHT